MIPSDDAASAQESVPRDEGGAVCATHPDVPAVATCNRCGGFVCVACHRLRSGGPHCPACDAHLGQGRIAWLDRRNMGRPKALWVTTRDLCLRPVVTFSGAQRTGSWWDATSYALFCIAAMWAWSFLLLYAISLPSFSGELETLRVWWLLLVMPTFAIAHLLLIHVLAAVEHGLLKLIGGASQGLGETYRVHCFGMAPALVALIPLCGVYAAPLLQMGCRAAGLSQVHRVPPWKAIFAVFTPAGVCCISYTGLMGIRIWADLG